MSFLSFFKPKLSKEEEDYATALINEAGMPPEEVIRQIKGECKFPECYCTDCVLEKSCLADKRRE